MIIKADLHVHTIYSLDGRIPLEVLSKRLGELKMGAIAVTDHNTITGALKLLELNPPFKVIVGEEISTTDGELIGLFLKERVKPLMSLEETACAIKEQGGLVCLPHPTARMVISRVKPHMLEKALEICDIVEGINGRNIFRTDDKKAIELARKWGKPVSAGSDVHILSDLNSCYVEMENFFGPEDFLQKLANARLVDNKKTSIIKTALLTVASTPLFIAELMLGFRLTK